MMRKRATVRVFEQPGNIEPIAAERGRKAYESGEDRIANPYSVSKRPFSRCAWEEGWISARAGARAAADARETACDPAR
jgi:hypothetical protein